MSRLSPIGLSSILSYIKSWVISKIPTKNSELTNDSGYITTSAVPTNYVTSDTDQVVSGVKTTSNYKYIVGPDMTKGTTPTSNRYVTIHRYYDKNMNAVGEYWLRQTATGNTELNFSAKDAFTNGARATTGTDISSYLSIGVNSSGKSYWEVNGGCRNNLLPLSSNNYTLGSSTLQWNKVYSKEYYINGTIMGDIVTHNNSEYAKSSHTHTKANITDFPAFGTTAGTICQGNDSRLSDARTPTSHTHTKSQITDFPSLATVATSGSYTDLSNKPTIPTVNNATLTIQKNGSNVATFTANASSNVTANITVPTKVSQLTNDSGYITGVAWGSVTDKPSFATVATSGSYNDLSNKPTIPTVNNATLTIQKNGSNVSTFTSNASSNVTCNITVPTNTNQLTNGAGFITSSGSCNYANSAGSASSTSSVSFSNNGQCYINAGGADCADAIDSQACNLAIRSWWSIGFYDQCYSKYAISMNVRDGVVRAHTLRAENTSAEGLQLGSYHLYVG